jgi:cobalamin biosynthesis protein CobD/CbiB
MPGECRVEHGVELERFHCIEGFAKGVLMAVNILYVVLYCALSLKLARAISCFSSVASDTFFLWSSWSIASLAEEPL